MKRFKVALTMVAPDKEAILTDLTALGLDPDIIVDSIQVIPYDGAWIPEPIRAACSAAFWEGADRRFRVVDTGGRVYVSNGEAAYRWTGAEAITGHEREILDHEFKMPESAKRFAYSDRNVDETGVAPCYRFGPKAFAPRVVDPIEQLFPGAVLHVSTSEDPGDVMMVATLDGVTMAVVMGLRG